jgi:hypothetical protein
VSPWCDRAYAGQQQDRKVENLAYSTSLAVRKILKVLEIDSTETLLRFQYQVFSQIIPDYHSFRGVVQQVQLILIY